MTVPCPVCKSKLKDYSESKSVAGKLGAFFSCPRCGDFLLSSSIQSWLPNKLNDDDEKIAILSNAIRNMQRDGSEPFLDSYLVVQILDRPLPSPTDQANNFILWLGENLKGPGEKLRVEPATHQSIMGSKTPAGFDFVLRHLFNAGLVVGDLNSDSVGQAYVTLTFEGWQYFADIKKGAVDSQKAFMAMKFGDSNLDAIVATVFKHAVRQTGFELYKLVDKPKAGPIDDRMRVEIRTSRFLIADLTHENAGAYWEAGFAEGLGKPVIYTCEKEKFDKDKTHFDTNHQLTIKWDKNNPEEAAEELKATIRATLPDEAKLTDD